MNMKLSISAFIDLAIGIFLVFSLISPVAFSMLDPKTDALWGFFAILLIGGEGTGLVIMLLFLKHIEQLVDRVNVSFISSLFLQFKRWIYTFLVSSVEGVCLLFASFIIIIPLIYIFQITTSIVGITPNTVEFQVDNSRLQAVAKEAFGWFFTDDYMMWFILCILIIAFSYFSLFLLKTLNFSIVRHFQESKENRAKYEKVLSMIKGEEVDIKTLQL